MTSEAEGGAEEKSAIVKISPSRMALIPCEKLRKKRRSGAEL